MQIEWDSHAIRDLQEIRAFIAADKPDAAFRVAERIKTSVQRLSEFPFLGRQTIYHGIRALAVTGLPYVVYYHFKPDAVLILAIIHGARRRFSD